MRLWAAQLDAIQRSPNKGLLRSWASYISRLHMMMAQTTVRTPLPSTATMETRQPLVSRELGDENRWEGVDAAESLVAGLGANLFPVISSSSIRSNRKWRSACLSRQ